jgi:hypothetical protein
MKTMKFMVMHKSDAQMEAGGPPPAKIIQEMGAFIRGAIERGEFVNGAGLHRSELRARVRCAGGTCSVQRGPFSGDNELVASFALIKARSIDGAIEVATRLAGAVGDVEIEVGRVVEPWDLGVMEKPADAPERYLLLRKADRAFEAGQAAPAGLAKLLAQLERDGTVDSTATLAPSSQGARYRKTAAGRAWTDGPFAESKELVAGFSIVELPSQREARTWAEAYARILGDNEVDIRQVAA